MLELALTLLTGLVAGAVVALRYIAPKTATKKDDAVLEVLETAEKIIPKK